MGVHVEDRGELEVGGVAARWNLTLRVNGPRVWGEEPQSGSSRKEQRGLEVWGVGSKWD